MREKLKQARFRIEALRLALVSSSPEDIAAALPGLEDALRLLETAEPDSLTRDELLFLKRDLRISTRLIAQGLAFCDGMTRILGAGPAYAATGQSLQVLPKGTLSLQG